MRHIRLRILALTMTLALLASFTCTFAVGTNPGGISVQMDGTNLTFTDATPESVNGRTFLPLRVVFEALGAKVDYNAATSTVIAVQGDKTLEMVVGAKEAVITEKGAARTVPMDAAAYLKNDRTYVPVRFAAEAFGCNVGWDQDSQTAIIVDVNKLLGSAETFTLFEQYMAYSAKQSTDKNMTISGDAAVTVKMLKDGALQTASAAGTLASISGEAGVQMTVSLKAAGLVSLLATDDTLSDTQRKMLAAVMEEIKAEIRVDLKNNVAYLQAPLLSDISGSPSAAWFSMDLGKALASTDGAAAMSAIANGESGSVADGLRKALATAELDDSEDGYQELKALRNTCINLLADSAFQKSGNTYTSTATHKDGDDEASLKLVLTGKGDEIVGISITGDLSDDGDSVAKDTTHFALSLDQNQTCKLALDMKFGANELNVTLTLKPASTTKPPLVAPDPTAQIISPRS